MAEIHWGATLTPSKQELVQAWIGQQRWYAAKGATPAVRRLRSYRFEDPAGEVGVEVMVVADDSGERTETYQIPLTYRGRPEPDLEHALIGTIVHGELGTRWVYDGCHDPVFADRLLAVIRGLDLPHASLKGALHDPTVRGIPHPAWRREARIVSSRVLSGEQSNTSIILDAHDEGGAPMPLIVKVFRRLEPGHNPDVELQGALAEHGCTLVPATAGHLTATWPAIDGVPVAIDAEDRPLDGLPGEPAAYDLAVAQEFLPGVQDAWRVASRAVDEGTDFTGPARLLGEATAQVHKVLADVMGTTPVTHETGTAIVEEMRGRFAAAVDEVDELSRFTPLVDRLLTEAADAPWPPMQRIHGDYHLGQVLHSPDRGWILLDFEGEPMRTLAERTLPDQWIRDVAGMLRSFDYCGGSWEQDNPGSARAWVTATQEAFLDGYAAVAGSDPRAHRALLTAFELDKAMYEVVYEARNRPHWVSIPVAAIDRLTAGHDDTQKES